ncbi:hypothetical protein ACOMHN_035861 [Nucella lapillus]
MRLLPHAIISQEEELDFLTPSSLRKRSWTSSRHPLSGRGMGLLPHTILSQEEEWEFLTPSSLRKRNERLPHVIASQEDEWYFLTSSSLRKRNGTSSRHPLSGRGKRLPHTILS